MVQSGHTVCYIQLGSYKGVNCKWTQLKDYMTFCDLTNIGVAFSSIKGWTLDFSVTYCQMVKLYHKFQFELYYKAFWALLPVWTTLLILSKMAKFKIWHPFISLPYDHMILCYLRIIRFKFLSNHPESDGRTLWKLYSSLFCKACWSFVSIVKETIYP